MAGPILGLLVLWMGLLLIPGTSSGGPLRPLPRSQAVVPAQALLVQVLSAATAATARGLAEADAPEAPISLDDHESERAADTAGSRTAACEPPIHASHYAPLRSAPLRAVTTLASLVRTIVDRRDSRGPPRASSSR